MLGIFYFGAAFMVAIVTVACWMRRENNKLNAPKFERGQIIANRKTGTLECVTNVDYHNRVLHTTGGWVHFSMADVIEVNDFVIIKHRNQAAKVYGIVGSRLKTSKGDVHFNECRR